MIDNAYWWTDSLSVLVFSWDLLTTLIIGKITSNFQMHAPVKAAWNVIKPWICGASERWAFFSPHTDHTARHPFIFFIIDGWIPFSSIRFRVLVLRSGLAYCPTVVSCLWQVKISAVIKIVCGYLKNKQTKKNIHVFPFMLYRPPPLLGAWCLSTI